MSQDKDLENPLLDIEKQQKQQSTKTVSLFSLFRYADGLDKVYMLIGSLSAIAAGCTTPFFMIFFSQISLIFVEDKRDQSQEEGLKIAIKFFILGGAAWFLNFLGLYCWNITGSRQALRFKKLYYKTLLDQQVAWYDANDVNKLATQISGNMVSVENAIGQKISVLLNVLMTSGFGFFYAYFKCWQLSLVLTGFLPLLLIAGVLMMKAMTLNAEKSKVSYENAAGVAQQAFSGIKTIKSLISEQFQNNRFVEALSKSQKKVIKYTFMSSASLGLMTLIFLGLYSFGFWYGKQLIIWFPANYQAPTVISTFFCFLVGGASVGQISPILKNIAEGKVAATKLFALIQRKKSLDQSLPGLKIDEFDSVILKNIQFKFKRINDDVKVAPNTIQQSKQDLLEQSMTETQENITKVLDDVSIQFPKGKVTAIVGQSGSGKSTLIQLIMRYYDPTSGGIFINGTNLKQIDTKYYRQQIGFVGQQPVLFSMSIKENLRLANPNLTDKQLEAILIKANAWSFINQNQDCLDTYVGNSGTQLSGGQKQRIAIARAIAKQPKILILDEATSALDRKNQRQIQKTLNNLSSGNIITIVIAHRLSTIKNADNIIVMNKGKILEQGTHQNLYSNQGPYYQLVKSQMAAEQHQNIQEKIEIEVNQFDKQEQMQKDDQKKTKTEDQKNQHTKQQLDSVFGKIFKQCKGNYQYIFVGAICAFINGSVYPLFNIAFSNILAMMAAASQNSHQINQYCLLFLAVAFSGGFCTFMYQFNFGITGQKLVFSLRKRLFGKLLRMPIKFYDSPNNTPGGLSTKLSQDSYQIHNMITGIVAVICLNVATVSLSLFFAFYHSWRLTLIVLGLSPLLVITGAINMAVLKNISKKAQEHEKEVGTLISDTVSNVRTVKSFGNQLIFCQKFDTKSESLHKINSEKALKSSFLQGLSKGSVMLVQGLTFYIAAILFANNLIEDPQSIYIAIFSVIFAAMGVGQNSQLMPDLGKAKNAGANIFEILQSRDQFQQALDTVQPSLPLIEGDFQFQNVVFRYPARDVIVLKDFSLKIKKGQKVGFVGPSGSGKSTIVQLLMRFYDIQSGTIKLNGHDIKKYDLAGYRNLIGMVSQQPALFLGTVKDNIIYNLPNNSKVQLQKFTKIAHAQKFIDEWDQKYQKQVGQKGIQISGGQKQRIALTRCLVRDPKILLLDQFTSALDADTQRIVFQNMKSAIKGKTSISIAHRLCTIEDADRIIVMRDGRIIEEGGYNQLIQKKENFYRLAKGLN